MIGIKGKVTGTLRGTNLSQDTETKFISSLSEIPKIVEIYVTGLKAQGYVFDTDLVYSKIVVALNNLNNTRLYSSRYVKIAMHISDKFSIEVYAKEV